MADKHIYYSAIIKANHEANRELGFCKCKDITKCKWLIKELKKAKNGAR